MATKDVPSPENAPKRSCWKYLCCSGNPKADDPCIDLEDIELQLIDTSLENAHMKQNRLGEETEIEQLEILCECMPLDTTLKDMVVDCTTKGTEFDLEDIPTAHQQAYTAVAITKAIENEDVVLFCTLLQRYQTISKSSGNGLNLNDALVCLYDCIRKNNAVLANMILQQMISEGQLEQSQELFDDIFRKALDHGCQKTLILLLNNKWYEIESKQNRKGISTYKRLIYPLLGHIPKENKDRVFLYILMSNCLVDFDEEFRILVSEYFPDEIAKLDKLMKFLETTPQKEPLMRQFYFEFLFSLHESADTFEEMYRKMMLISSNHSFTSTKKHSDYSLKREILENVNSHFNNTEAEKETEDIKNAIRTCFMNLCREIECRLPWLKCEPKLVGSSFEGTQVFIPREFDIFIKFTKLSGYFKIHISESLVNYTLESKSDDLKDILEDDDGLKYLSADKLKEVLYLTIRNIIKEDVNSIWNKLNVTSYAINTNDQLNSGMSKYRYNCQSDGKLNTLCADSRLSIEPIGMINVDKFACITFTWRGEHFPFHSISVDIVPGFDHKPGNSINVAPHVYLNSCKTWHIVAYGSPIGFQMCPDLHENLIIQNIPNEIRVGYIYVKAVRRTLVLQSHKSDPCILNINNYETALPTYALKQIVIKLTAEKKSTKRSPEEWAVKICEMAKSSLSNSSILRIEKYLVNPDNSVEKECAVKYDQSQIDISYRRRQNMIAILERMLALFNAKV